MKLFLLGLAICYLSLKTPRFATPDTPSPPPYNHLTTKYTHGYDGAIA